MKRIALTACVLALAACGDDNDPTRLARVDEVILEPADTTLEHPDFFTYRVTLLDESGDVIDDGIARPMQFSASNQAAVNVASNGIVETEAAGATAITVQVSGTTATATLLVTDDVQD